AAPGATLVNTSGREISTKQNGTISLIGPLVNTGLFVIFWLLMILGVCLNGKINQISVASPENFLISIGFFGCIINAAIVFFNMLPVDPLDGKKILKWDAIVFAIMIAVAIGLLFLAYKSPAIVMLFFGQ
ncbi:MAG TPA: peptidase M50, partial [Methanocorpusculum sp.]|nr:peptidase M50 [Methanocorpusculum sp.]